MSRVDHEALEQALNLLPDRYRGPAGVAGLMKDGDIIARRAWGFADMERRLPMTTASRLPICSISKHMTCALLLDMFGDPSALDPLLPELLPNFQAPRPRVADLCHNQSGLRDYWALTVLQGAVPEGLFSEEDGLRLLSQAKTGHFAPGAHYSYSNGNFRLLAELIRRASGRDFGELLRERIFDPAAMTGAVLAPDTRQTLDGVLGYEGNDTVGFLPAKSGIFWFGDAGISASLDDMLAWERHIDATRDDPASLYNRISVPVRFADGKQATYGYGIRRERLGGYDVTAHGGGLRGFCSYRMHVASERLSVVVIFNHEASAMRAAWSLMEAALGCRIGDDAAPANGWTGLWLDEAQGLYLRAEDRPEGVQLHYATAPIMCTPQTDGTLRARDVTLRQAESQLLMERPSENLSVIAKPVSPVPWADGAKIAGYYFSEEIDARLKIEARDGGTYVSFEGMLGQGPMERMYPLADDLWIVTTRRSMDAAPPGDWTMQIRRDAHGEVSGLTLGCWLARNIDYRRAPGSGDDLMI